MTESAPGPKTPNAARGTVRRVWLVTGAVLAAAALVIGVTGIVAALQRTSTETRYASQTYPRSAAHVQVDVDRGKVTIAGGDAGRVETQHARRWSGGEPSVDETWSGDTLRVDGRCPDSLLSWIGQVCSVEYAAQVPRDAGADVGSTTGSIEVGQLGGQLGLSATTGSITVEDVSGPLTARATTGDITGSGLRSDRVDAEVSTGDVTLRFAEPPERLTAAARTGDVTIEVPRSGGPYRVDARTNTGEQQVDVAQDPDAAPERTIDVTTSTGDIHVRYADRGDR
ncbi:putative adhesin [Haloactinopolyspora alba]|uniref:Putative adhesin n=1 Tax=Haloactinopolyspora alba TaxID=648780 RepID=A0A2P8DY70_9ACTN|nr:DUF4097 family beta strand repeat-containing protein [Haloactinopolyspora alba]PSL02127.1 putative adhesin [Haloactinopolyspora alba]